MPKQSHFFATKFIHLFLHDSFVKISLPWSAELSQTSAQTFVLKDSASLGEMTDPLTQTKCWKGIQVMWRLKQTRLSELSLCSLSAKDTTEKENSHYLMSHLKSALSI